MGARKRSRHRAAPRLNIAPSAPLGRGSGAGCTPRDRRTRRRTRYPHGAIGPSRRRTPHRSTRAGPHWRDLASAAPQAGPGRRGIVAAPGVEARSGESRWASRLARDQGVPEIGAAHPSRIRLVGVNVRAHVRPQRDRGSIASSRTVIRNRAAVAPFLNRPRWSSLPEPGHADRVLRRGTLEIKAQTAAAELRLNPDPLPEREPHAERT
jgi:hypothetical protein